MKKAQFKEIKVTTTEFGITVSFVYDGVDRPTTYGICVGKNQKLANRLVAATKAGKVVEFEAEIATDVFGKTYANHGCKVMGRYLNSSLKKIGF